MWPLDVRPPRRYSFCCSKNQSVSNVNYPSYVLFVLFIDKSLSQFWIFFFLRFSKRCSIDNVRTGVSLVGTEEINLIGTKHRDSTVNVPLTYRSPSVGTFLNPLLERSGFLYIYVSVTSSEPFLFRLPAARPSGSSRAFLPTTPPSLLSVVYGLPYKVYRPFRYFLKIRSLTVPVPDTDRSSQTDDTSLTKNPPSPQVTPHCRRTESTVTVFRSDQRGRPQRPLHLCSPRLLSLNQCGGTKNLTPRPTHDHGKLTIPL